MAMRAIGTKPNPGFFLAIGASIALAFASAAAAQDGAPAADPHKIFEQRCMRCHTGHAADLARQKMKIAGGELQVARTGKPTAALLSSHYGVKLAEAELKALLELFEDGIGRKGAFQHRCALCHGHAVEFARGSLILKDGTLRTKAGDADVAAFLKTHHEATPEELDVIVTMLKEQLQGGK
jgi:cytochrome c5